MAKRIIYVPLEPYKERYTVQLSAKDGWLESNWKRAGRQVIRVEGQSLSNTQGIKTGQVLDAHGRGYWACSQIMELIRLHQQGVLDPKTDVIYFDDFWHPGISALPYLFHMTGQSIPAYAMLHAQSVDIHDFTYPMRHWMRHFEKGTAAFLSGIFVTSKCLYDLCLYAGVGTKENLFFGGLPYNSREVKRLFFPETLLEKKKQVIYSSRWDKEKCPGFFLDVIREVHQQRPDIKFVITTSAEKIRSNDISLVHLLNHFLATSPAASCLDVRVNQTKKQYYQNLLESKIQFNCADQDFVSWTLLEATTCGCRPVYPNYLSFPEALQYRYELMYNKNDIQSAVQKIIQHIDEPPQDWSWVYAPFDKSWERMLAVMEGGICR